MLRNLDVGSWLAGRREFFFSLLIESDARSLLGRQRIQQYATERPRLAHRPDLLDNVKGVSTLYWRQVAGVLEGCGAQLRQDEAEYARRALTFMRQKSLSEELKDN